MGLVERRKIVILLKKLTKAVEMFRKRNARENTNTRNTPSPRTKRNAKNENINLGPEHVHNLVQGRVHVLLKKESL